MFRLQCAMCFGPYLNDDELRKVQSINRRILLGLPRFKFNVLNYWPKLTRISLAGRWAEIQDLKMELNEVFLGLIRARIKANQKNQEMTNFCCVDLLLELSLPKEEGGREKINRYWDCHFVQWVPKCKHWFAHHGVRPGHGQFGEKPTSTSPHIEFLFKMSRKILGFECTLK